MVNININHLQEAGTDPHGAPFQSQRNLFKMLNISAARIQQHLHLLLIALDFTVGAQNTKAHRVGMGLSWPVHGPTKAVHGPTKADVNPTAYCYQGGV